MESSPRSKNRKLISETDDLLKKKENTREHTCTPKRRHILDSIFIYYAASIILIFIAVLLSSKLTAISIITKSNPFVIGSNDTLPTPITPPTIKPVKQHYKPIPIFMKPIKDNAFEDLDFVSKGYLNFYNAVLEQRMLFKLYLNDLKSNSLSQLQRSKLKDLCLFLVENSVKRLDVAKGYDCLLQLHNKKANRNSELDTFKAIKYASLSIETFYTIEAATDLMRLIISDYENEIRFLEKNTENITKYATGYRDDENEFLGNVLKLNIPALNRRVMLRRSFIHKFGRSSSNEDTKLYDLRSVIDDINYIRNSIKIKQNNILDIVLTFDEYFVPGATVCLVSALMNSDLDTFYRFHVLMDPENPLSEGSQKNLSSLEYIREYSIEFTYFPKEWISELFREKTSSENIMYRLYLDKIFTDLETVLYLDADTIVLTDLNALKRVDMTHYIWAGAPDCMYRYNRPECNGVLPNFYVNGGVLLVNLTNMRRNQIIEKMEENLLFVDECDFHLCDQDLINTVMADYIYYLSFRWNSIIFWNNARYHFNSFIVHHLNVKVWDQPDKNMWKTAPTKMLSHKQEWWRYRELVGW